MKEHSFLNTPVKFQNPDGNRDESGKHDLGVFLKDLPLSGMVHDPPPHRVNTVCGRCGDASHGSKHGMERVW
jgi:hypothetical protein